VVHLGIAVLALGWPALFARRLEVPRAPDQEATVEVVMGDAAQQAGTEAPPPARRPPEVAPEPVPPSVPAAPSVPVSPPTAAAESPGVLSPGAAETPVPPAKAPPEARPPRERAPEAAPREEKAPPAWQSSTLLGDGAVGASAIIGERLRPAVGERGNVPPGYPGLSAQLGEQGIVVVRMRIDADGQVTDVRVLQTSGYDRLDEAAVAALARWHFTPAIENGEAVESFQDLPIRFRLH
jgi:protein TonB